MRELSPWLFDKAQQQEVVPNVQWEKKCKAPHGLTWKEMQEFTRKPVLPRLSRSCSDPARATRLEGKVSNCLHNNNR